MPETPAAEPPPALPSEQAVLNLLATRAAANERIVSYVRIALVAATFSRALWIWSIKGTVDEPVRFGLTLGAGLVAFGFSLHVLVGRRSRTLSHRMLASSVALDAAVCFVGLVMNPLYSAPGYPGLLYMPDPAVLLVVMVGASLRLSTPIAVFGTALNTAAFAVLVWIDWGRGTGAETSPLEPLALWAIVLPTMVAITILMTWVMRELTATSAQRAVEAERARRGLGAVLEDHHDVRTLLSSAALNAELVQHALRNADGPRDELGRLARALSDDLSQVNRFVAGIRERAWGELSALDSPVEVDVAAALETVVGDLRGRVEPELHVRADGGASAVVVGGEPALRRVLQNLIVNACEGDGRERARRVDVCADRGDNGALRVSVEDDGPGFPEPVLRANRADRITTKPGGSGLGLALVETLLAPNGSRLEIRNRGAGGASVRFELPAPRD